MPRHLVLILTFFAIMAAVQACSRQILTSHRSAPRHFEPLEPDVRWQHACVESSLELAEQAPVWWNRWRLALEADSADAAQAELRSARQEALHSFQAILASDTPGDGSGASGPELRAWMAAWVQSATPLLVIDARGFVWSDAVACPQARAWLTEGNPESASALLAEARPALRPGSCAERCLSVLPGQ